VAEPSDRTVLVARALRLAAIRDFFEMGILKEKDALKMLNGPLSPIDPTSPVIDDSGFLHSTIEQLREAGLLVDRGEFDF
jgi:hypothetical protein